MIYIVVCMFFSFVDAYKDDITVGKLKRSTKRFQRFVIGKLDVRNKSNYMK
jgi:hypothetical protein